MLISKAVQLKDKSMFVNNVVDVFIADVKNVPESVSNNIKELDAANVLLSLSFLNFSGNVYKIAYEAISVDPKYE